MLQPDVSGRRSDYPDFAMVNRAAPHRIMVVDDVPAVREALRWAFEAEPEFQIVAEASDGLDAISQTRRLDLDIVILDIELPRMDGYAVAQALKALARPPVIILLSVHSDDDARQRGAELADGFVDKSAGWTVLLHEVRRALAERAS